MWFSWCGTFDVIKAWKREGIVGNKLCPELIDRVEFIDQNSELTQSPHSEAAGSPRPSTLAEAQAKPPGMRSRSFAATEAKVQQLRAFAQKMVKKNEDP
jgi:hypothetical protein